MPPEKSAPPSSNFCLIILSHGINEFFSTRSIENKLIQLASPQTKAAHLGREDWLLCYNFLLDVVCLFVFCVSS